MRQRDLLRWTFDDDHGQRELRSGRRRRPGPWRALLIALAFGLAMLGAGTGGYVLGRYQQALALARVDLQNVIDLEGWARQEGNRVLLQSTLDPAARGKWRAEFEEQFDAAARVPRQVTIEGLSLYGDRARVAVKMVEAGRTQREVRFYRLVDGQWRRTAPGNDAAPRTP